MTDTDIDADADTRERLELTRTLELRIAADPDLARTIVQAPRKSIYAPQPASARGRAALSALQKLGASTAGRLSLHHTLGEGGMGIVHLATQTTIGRHVAVKTRRVAAARPDDAGGQSEASDPSAGDGLDDIDATLRILREAWVMGALEHPNVVPVYDVGLDEAGAPVIVMKRIEGLAWADLMRAPDEIERRFGATDPLEWNLRILATACNAVHFAHSRGILHRDLKPENVMIGAFGEVYVLDWGIAVSLTPDPSGRLPHAGDATDIVGTPAYMAPEMVMGDPARLSPRTDVYLLGAILYEIFTGAPPHDGPTLQAMLSRVLLSSPAYPATFPQEARAICARAMARDAAGRFESAEALRLAVEEYLRHRDSRRIASEAKRSLDRLIETIEGEPPGDERALAVFNLLGECRFGYRSALSAWPENERARQGLDRALLAVVEHELVEGDPGAAATLLREVSAPPMAVAGRVATAQARRAAEDERLRKLAVDLDPRVGGRTRVFISAVFGAAWVALPLVAWCAEWSGKLTLTHRMTVGWSAFFFALSLALVAWARETMTRTQFNRRVGLTLALYLGAQVMLAAGAWAAGLRPHTSIALVMFASSVTEGLLAVWVEPWFGVSAGAALASFLATTWWPGAALPLLSADSLILTLVVQLAWFPRQDLLKMRDQRVLLHRRARAWLSATGPVPPATKRTPPVE